jgi:DNA polymerase-3 subunit beta
MEIRVSVAELTKALTMMQGVVQRKNTMPILSNVLMETEITSEGNGNLILSVTDLDIGMKLTRPCEVIEPGAITVSARALLDIVKMLPGPDVTLKGLPNQHLNIKSARTNARLLALAPEEFPKLPDISGTQFFPIEVAQFSEMVHKTLYSTSMDENRYNLTGVYFEPQKENPNTVVLVSTDGHRLSRIEATLGENKFDMQQPVILPRKGLTEMLRLLESVQPSDKSTFLFGFSANQAIVCTENTVLTMRVIDGKFPDYQQVIPKLSDKIMRASRADFLTSLRRVSVLASDKTQSVKLMSRQGELTVSCVNPDAGEVSDDVPIEYNGPDIEIGFNAKYIIDALSSLSDTNIMMKFTDPLSPALLIGINEGSHLCVVMPMRM